MTKIKLMTEDGIIATLSCEQFEKYFGVKYLEKLTIDDGVSSLSPNKLGTHTGWHSHFRNDRERMERELSKNLVKSDLPDSQRYSDGERKAWLWGDQIRNSYVADVYVGVANELVGHGLFANEELPPGRMIGEYTGVVRKAGTLESQRRNCYLFSYAGDNLVIDAEKSGNVTRFINHSEGGANAHFVRVIVDETEHVIMIAIKKIEQGAQVLFDYGPDYWPGRDIQPVIVEA